jgi:hypothetical protein
MSATAIVVVRLHSQSMAIAFSNGTQHSETSENSRSGKSSCKPAQPGQVAERIGVAFLDPDLNLRPQSLFKRAHR